MAVSNLFLDVARILSSAWSWWLEGTNQNHERARIFLTLISSSLLILWFIWMMFSKKSKPRNPKLPPGPLGVPLLGNLPFLDPDLHTYFASLAKTYGPIFKLRLGSKLGIVVTGPSLVKEVLKDQDITFANRDVPAVARTMAYGASDILWTPYGPEWRMLRKVCVREMLSNASLDAVYSLRQREVRRMVREIYMKVGLEVNLGEQLFLTILNVITSMLWGGGSGDDERKASLGAEFREVVSDITDILGKPNLSDFFPVLARFDLQGIQRDIKRSLLKFDAIFESIIEERTKVMESSEAATESPKDFLQILLQLKDDEDAKTPFTMKHLKALLMDMVVGGTETTSNALEWALAELMNKTETMTKAQEELKRVVGIDNEVEEYHLPKLHYLHAVMKEVLRLHPAAPLLVPHCPISSCNIGGYLVPKGARVFINVWAIHRDPSFWDDPSNFDPERFLDNSKWDYSGNDFNYIPFGSGRRICAGIPMAERMFLYQLATLLHSFNWELPAGTKLDLKEKFGIVLKKATPLFLVPKPRFSKLALYGRS